MAEKAVEREVLAIVPNFWGAGETREEALKNLRKHGGNPQGAKFYSVPRGTVIDGFGFWIIPMGYDATDILDLETGKPIAYVEGGTF